VNSAVTHRCDCSRIGHATVRHAVRKYWPSRPLERSAQERAALAFAEAVTTMRL
jgi:alkylhydroperoxidase family enzyme